MQRRFLSSAKGPGDGSGLLVSARPTFVGWRRGRTSSQRVRLNHALMHATAEDLYFRTLTLPLSQQLHGRTGASGAFGGPARRLDHGWEWSLRIIYTHAGKINNSSTTSSTTQPQQHLLHAQISQQYDPTSVGVITAHSLDAGNEP
jgi:hypothetical protein